jgi:hypothetical protein
VDADPSPERSSGTYRNGRAMAIQNAMPRMGTRRDSLEVGTDLSRRANNSFAGELDIGGLTHL